MSSKGAMSIGMPPYSLKALEGDESERERKLPFPITRMAKADAQAARAIGIKAITNNVAQPMAAKIFVKAANDYHPLSIRANLQNHLQAIAKNLKTSWCTLGRGQLCHCSIPNHGTHPPK